MSELKKDLPEEHSSFGRFPFCKVSEMGLQCFLKRISLFSVELCHDLGVCKKAVISPFLDQC